MPVVFAWAKKPPLCKGGTDRRRWSGGIERSGGIMLLGFMIGCGSTAWVQRHAANPSVGVRRQLPLHKGAVFAFLQPTCPVRERSMTAQALGCPGTGPPLRFNCNPSSFPCQRGLSSMGLRPLSGLLHALCAFLSPLPCFWAMVRKILPICYLFDSPRPYFALHRPLFALHPNIFSLHRRNFVQSALAPEGKI